MISRLQGHGFNHYIFSKDLLNSSEPDLAISTVQFRHVKLKAGVLCCHIMFLNKDISIVETKSQPIIWKTVFMPSLHE